MKTKPFELSAALKGAKVVTRDGHPFTNIVIDSTKSQPISGTLDGVDYSKSNYLKRWSLNGRYYEFRDVECCSDLVLLDESPRYTEGKTYKKPHSLRDSLEITHDMWRDIEEGKTSNKALWLSEHGNHIPWQKNECGCCEYAYQFTAPNADLNCSVCPLRSLWPGLVGCEHSVSPYSKWKATKDPQYAKQIADAAESELRKLDDMEKNMNTATCNKTEDSNRRAKSGEDVCGEMHKPSGLLCTLIKGHTCDHEAWHWALAAKWPIEQPKEPRYRAWTRDEIPLGVWLKLPSGDKVVIVAISLETVYFAVGTGATLQSRTTQSLIDNKIEHSLDHGKTWQPCGVLVEE